MNGSSTMKRDGWRALLWMILIFACGALTGGAAVQLRTTALLRGLLSGPTASLEPRVKLFLLERGLSLRDAQRERILPILEASAKRLRAVRERVEPDVAPLRQAERAAIRELLDPEQRQRYDRRLTEIDAALGRTPSAP
jgi:hypothetical protein